MRSICVAMFVALLMGCQSSRAPAAGMASLRVKVVAEPKEGVKMASTKLRVYDTPASSPPKETGDFEKVDYADLGEIVVWLEPAGGGKVAGIASPIRVDVRGTAAKADALSVVSVGQKVSFRNAGAAAINVYSVSEGNEFDLGELAAGATGEFVVKSAGLIEVLTDSVKEPIAVLYTTPTTWNALTQSSQSVHFENLPPGAYRVYSWHPRLPGGEAAVTLATGQVGFATVKVGVNGLPKVQASTR